MKINSLLIILLFLISNCFSATAQLNDRQATEAALLRIANVRDNESTNDRYANVQGLPFLYENWQKGRVYLKGKDSTVLDVTLNLDLVTELMLVRFDSETTGAISPFRIERLEVFDTGNSKRNFIIMSEKELLNNLNRSPIFIEVLYDGAFKLLRRIQKRMYQPYPTPYSTDDGHREIATIESIWLQKPGESHYKKVKLRRGYLEKTLPSYRKDIRQLSKQNKLNLRDLQDVIRLLKLLEATD